MAFEVYVEMCETCKTEIRRDGRTVTGWRHLDTSQNRHSPRPEIHRCGAVGALMVGGKVVGQLRCELDAGHETLEVLTDHGWVVKTPHRVVLEWTPEREVDLDLFDPAEHFDAEVPMPAEGPRGIGPLYHGGDGR